MMVADCRLVGAHLSQQALNEEAAILCNYYYYTLYYEQFYIFHI